MLAEARAAAARASAPVLARGFNQTAFMFGVLAAAWVFFITVRGDLAKWLGLLGVGGSSATTRQAAATSSSAGPLGIPAIPAIPPISGGL